VLVADVAGLERIGMGVDRQHDFDYVAHCNIGGMEPVPTALAEEEPDAVLWKAPDRVAERLDPS
jgi:hypothetical protein